MTPHPLPSPPRTLPISCRLALWFGHFQTVLGTILFTAVALALWTFIAFYGISFSQLRLLLGPQQHVPATVETFGWTPNKLGESHYLTVANFVYQDRQYRAYSFGEPPTPWTAHQPTEVFVPDQHPEASVIAGLHKFPISLKTLGRFTFYGLSPGLFLILLGLSIGRRQEQVLRFGQQELPRRIQHQRLIVPFHHYFLDRYEVNSPLTQGQRLTYWRLGFQTDNVKDVLHFKSAVITLSRLVVSPSPDAPLQAPLPRRLGSVFFLVCSLGQAALFILFLLT